MATTDSKNLGIGRNWPPSVIAEMSANRLQNIASELERVDFEAEADVISVKLNRYRPDVFRSHSNQAEFTIRGDTLRQVVFRHD